MFIWKNFYRYEDIDFNEIWNQTEKNVFFYIKQNFTCVRFRHRCDFHAVQREKHKFFELEFAF